MNDFAVPLSYRSYRQIQQVSNVGSLESKHLLAKSNEHSSIQVNNPPPSDVKETDLDKKQRKEEMIKKSLEQDRVYNSYLKYHPRQLWENSPEGQMAILRYLLDMRKNNYKLEEVEMDKVI